MSLILLALLAPLFLLLLGLAVEDWWRHRRPAVPVPATPPAGTAPGSRPEVRVGSRV